MDLSIIFLPWITINSLILGFKIISLKKYYTNIFLSLLFFSIFIQSGLKFFSNYTTIISDYNLFIPCNDFASLMYGPLFYLYITHVMGTKSYKFTYLLHFVIPFAFLFYFISIKIIDPGFGKGDYLNTPLHTGVLGFVVVSRFLYFVGALRAYFKNKSSLKKNLSDQIFVITWIKILLILFSCSTLLITISQIIRLNNPTNLIVGANHPITSNLSLIVFSMILVTTDYITFKYPEILNYINSPKKVFQTKEKEKEKENGKSAIPGAPVEVVVKSRLTEADPILAYMDNLSSLMEYKKIYLESSLTQGQLASELKIPSYVLSKMLNENIGKNFNQYINEYRVKEATRILSDPKLDHLTMYAVALDSGFKNPSVFYENFKKYTGLTPTDFKKTLNKEKV